MITFPLTLMLILAIFMIARSLIVTNKLSAETQKSQIVYIKYVGILSLTLGIFGQVLGLYGAFTAMEQAGDVSPHIVYGGLKISSITTIYGMVIFLCCYVSWVLLKAKIERSETSTIA